MGLFDFLGKKKDDGAPKKKSEREIARLGRLVQNKLSQNYDRQEAIEELGKMATPEAAAALLKRFDWTMDPSITDQEEKDSAVRGLVAAGEAALDPIRAYCKRAESLTWPLKALRRIVPEDRYQDELLGLLDEFDTEYRRNPEPKVQLLNGLEDYQGDEVREAVEPFLQDASEPVRFAAVTTVYAIGSAESIPALIAALEEEESLRIKNRIAQGFADRRWQVPPELQGVARESLPDLYTLDGDEIRQL
jgi:hypothetical protein